MDHESGIMVPDLCINKADGRTQKKHSMEFRHIGYNDTTWILIDNRSFRKVLVCGIVTVADSLFYRNYGLCIILVLVDIITLPAISATYC